MRTSYAFIYNDYDAAYIEPVLLELTGIDYSQNREVFWPGNNDTSSLWSISVVIASRKDSDFLRKRWEAQSHYYALALSTVEPHEIPVNNSNYE